MITIKPIEVEQISQAKAVILGVAWRLLEFPVSYDELVKMADEHGWFSDIDEFQSYYSDRRGLFLVSLDDQKVVGTGGVAQWNDDIGELRRMWLLEPYQGRGIGYRLATELLSFARSQGYKIIRLDTGDKQLRAIRFYERLGFHRIERYKESDTTVFMELELFSKDDTSWNPQKND